MPLRLFTVSNPSRYMCLLQIDRRRLSYQNNNYRADAVRQFAIESTGKQISFENLAFYSELDLQNMNGLKNEPFLDFHSMLKKHIRETPV